MEDTTNKGSVWKTGLNYGLITGLVIIIYMLLTYLLDVERKSYLNMLPYVFFIGGIIWGSKTHRDINNNGYSTYSQALGSGFIVALFASLLVGIFTYILYKADPALMNELIAQQEDELIKAYEEGEINMDQYEQSLEFFRYIFTPAVIAIMSFVTNILINLLFSLIIALFIKREHKL